MCFEGEYINDERNGKGKEYLIYDNFSFNSTPTREKILIFEGEYLKNKRGMEKDICSMVK